MSPGDQISTHERSKSSRDERHAFNDRDSNCPIAAPEIIFSTLQIRECVLLAALESFILGV